MQSSKKIRIPVNHPNTDLAGNLLLVTEETEETYAGYIQPKGFWIVVSRSEIDPPQESQGDRN